MDFSCALPRCKILFLTPFDSVDCWASTVEALAVDLAVVPERVPEDHRPLHRERHHAKLRERSPPADDAVAQLIFKVTRLINYMVNHLLANLGWVD